MGFLQSFSKKKKTCLWMRGGRAPSDFVKGGRGRPAPFEGSERPSLSLEHAGHEKNAASQTGFRERGRGGGGFI